MGISFQNREVRSSEPAPLFSQRASGLRSERTMAMWDLWEMPKRLPPARGHTLDYAVFFAQNAE